MDKSENTFEFGLMFWQILMFAISFLVIYFLVKLGRRMMKYYGRK